MSSFSYMKFAPFLEYQFLSHMFNTQHLHWEIHFYCLFNLSAHQWGFIVSLLHVSVCCLWHLRQAYGTAFYLRLARLGAHQPYAELPLVPEYQLSTCQKNSKRGVPDFKCFSHFCSSSFHLSSLNPCQNLISRDWGPLWISDGVCHRGVASRLFT